MKESRQPNSSSTEMDAAELFKCGAALAQSKDYGAAMKYYLQASAQGSGAADNQIGFLYLYGLGVSKDHPEACKWFRRAAERGCAAGQDHLGLCHKHGFGLNRDYAKAIEWFRKAADQGFGPAQYNIALLYHHGLGVKCDCAEAVAWYRKSANQGLSLAQNSLGMCYLQGVGIEKDLVQAFAWFRRAAEQALSMGQNNLGIMYQNGWGVEQSYAEALNWFVKAAAEGFAEAQNSVGWFCRNGWGTRQDFDAALKWFQKAAEKNHPPAFHNIGSLYENGLGVEKNLSKALDWYRKAAERGFSPSRQRLQLHEAAQVGGSEQVTVGSNTAARPTAALVVASAKEACKQPALSPKDDASTVTTIRSGSSEEQAAKGARERSAAPSTFNVGDLIQGTLQVESILYGGMGIVYICRRRLPLDPTRIDETGGRLPMRDLPTEHVAVKTIRPELLQHSDVARRFNREAHVWMSLLPHPNLVQAKGFFNANGILKAFGGTPLLHLEYAAGGNLRSRLHGAGLPEEEVLRISMEFCNAMHFLYESARIVHRDIKPENILFTHTGCVKVTDFGLASAILALPRRKPTETSKGDLESSPELTQFAAILGTLPYMSPEQYASPHEVTVAADVYSFGVVLYEMLTGHLPFEARSFGEWRTKHVQEIPAFPSSFAQVPEGLSAIAMKCLQKKSAHRFGDFAELRGALESYCHSNGRPALIPPATRVPELEAKMTAEDWTSRGFALGQLGDDTNSLENYARALEKDQTYAGLNCNIATVLWRLGRREEAFLHYKKEVELHAEEPMFRVLLGEWYLAAGRTEEGLESIRVATQLDPGSIIAWEHYALALHAVGARGEDYKHAVANVKGLLNSARYNDVAWAIDAAVVFGQAAHLDVFTDFHILTVQKFPQNPICWYNFGVAAHRIGRLDAALRLYSQAIDLDKQLTLAFVNRGLVHAVRGERPQAERDWRSAIAVDAGDEASKIAESLLQIAPGTEFTKALEERSPGRPGTTVNYLQTESPSNWPIIRVTPESGTVS